VALEWKHYTCNCCGVSYEVELERYSPTPFQCDGCLPHRDAATQQELLAQREDHKRLWALNMEEMQDRIEKAERRTESVYHTRGLALAALNQINATHAMRPDGSCSCRVKSCKVGPILAEDRLLASVIRAYDAREQRRLARIRREEGWDEYAAEWDGFIDERVVTPAKFDPEASETG
jgi:hypothetical protein